MPILPDISRSQAEAEFGNFSWGMEKVVATTPWWAQYSTVPMPANNTGVFQRIRWPRSGTINRFQVFGGVGSGNIDIGAYTCDANTRTLLGHTGSKPSVSDWNDFAPLANFNVTGGDWADLCLSCDNTTATFVGFTVGITSPSRFFSGWDAIPGTAQPFHSWYINAGMFPLPATCSDFSAAGHFQTILIMARYA